MRVHAGQLQLILLWPLLFLVCFSTIDLFELKTLILGRTSGRPLKEVQKHWGPTVFYV
jgi:hypothetical protein